MAKAMDMAVTKLRSRMGAGLLRMHYEGKRLIPCIIEIIKNARDWGGKKIWIDTENEREFRFVDNGKGLSDANMNAFVSFHCTTAHGTRQSGKFGSGTKHFLYSHSLGVRVRTAPESDPDFVYVFEFTPEELEKLALSTGELAAERVPKDKSSWPYESRFGSEFTYRLREPHSRKIIRGDALAAELAARLPMKFQNAVLVDGTPLPRKPIVGDVFQLDMQHDVLGLVNFEVYRPARRAAEDELRFGSREIGEIPVGDFVRNLGDLASRFPEILTLPQVAGTITCDYLRDFEKEDRNSVRPEIVDDPRTHHFVKLLEDHAEEMGRRLQISLGAATSGGVEREISEVVALCNRAFGKGKQPPGRRDITTEVTVAPEPDAGSARPNAKPLTLDFRTEYELGERIAIGAALGKTAAKDFGPSDIEWDTEQAGSSKVSRTPQGVQFTAERLGGGIVRATLPGTNIQAIAKYVIVKERVFRVSTPMATIDLGGKLLVTAVNSDKLRGDVKWELEGPGRIEADGARVMYYGERSGEARIFAYDSKRPSTRAESFVVIESRGEKPGEMICLDGIWFAVYHHELAETYAQPVTMMSTGTDQHRVFINHQAPGFEAARRKGNVKQFFIQALALEFARFSNFELKGKLDAAEVRDLPHITGAIHAEAFQLFERILGNDDMSV